MTTKRERLPDPKPEPISDFEINHIDTLIRRPDKVVVSSPLQSFELGVYSSVLIEAHLARNKDGIPILWLKHDIPGTKKAVGQILRLSEEKMRFTKQQLRILRVDTDLPGISIRDIYKQLQHRIGLQCSIQIGDTRGYRYINILDAKADVLAQTKPPVDMDKFNNPDFWEEEEIDPVSTPEKL